jgi:hypothetical protein
MALPPPDADTMAAHRLVSTRYSRSRVSALGLRTTVRIPVSLLHTVKRSVPSRWSIIAVR